ncbi:hypothetical protein BBROOKSOX_1370 [Bathymodiolus brooksi thiotrophic gill symbiont]|nr:hypothetical protein BBROOKSOX_1370 [Bathymodiolus brooksi thiotrophic gill symbiont]
MPKISFIACCFQNKIAILHLSIKREKSCVHFQQLQVQVLQRSKLKTRFYQTQ